MKKALINAAKVILPLAIGVWLVYKQYVDLNTTQRNELFQAFGQANMPMLLLATAIGWLAHLSRGWRWRYLLKPLGYKTGFWNCYNGVMVGYFVNMFIPRAGEASRAVSLYRVEGVPFEKGFGTILAERVVDLLMLLVFAGVALVLQLDKLDLFQERIAQFNAGQQTSSVEGTVWGWWVIIALLVIGAVGLYFILTRPALRARAVALFHGFLQGLQTVMRTDKKLLFLLHTVFIWAAYLGMFWIGFHCLPSTQEVPLAGILAGFIAGAVGIILVQGGIGVYPAFVALMVGVYMPQPEGGGLLRPDALAMG
ncbi:MAG TPA: lysylphosphatidylglycerol synthase transmembrane domain-containing protein, partial [Flavobacteriales bacterium]|nr:lysylphosphatidylglycerol synthase transmembrane domain-containing protein [Flavobacteriales bacterium]